MPLPGHPSALKLTCIANKMKFSAATVAVVAAAAYFFSPTSAASMAELKELKMATWSAQAEAGAYDVNRYQAFAASTPCVNGKAGEYRCNNVDLVSFLRHQDMGSSTRKGNDVCKLPLIFGKITANKS